MLQLPKPSELLMRRPAKAPLEPLQLLTADGNKRQVLAFGVTWQTVVSKKARDRAKKAALQRGATHCLTRDQQFGSGRVLPGDLRTGERLFPAARILARRIGSGICVMELGANVVWVTVAQNGQATTVDKLFPSTNDALAEAKAIYTHWENDGVSLALHTNLEAADKALGDATIYPLRVEDLLSSIEETDSTLQAFVKEEAPKPLVIAATILSLAFLGYKAFDYYRAQELAAARAAEEAARAVNPELAWQQALQDWASTAADAKGANGEGIARARKSLGDLPADLEGWLLVNASCAAGAMPNSSTPGATVERAWTCRARYTRGLAAAVTREFHSAVSSEWDVQYPDLSTALVAWSFVESTQPLGLDVLLPKMHHQTESASHLQRLLPALQDGMPFAFEPVLIPPPLDADGAPIPRLASTPSLSKMQLVAKGPMRSIDALIATEIPVDWHELTISSIQAYPDTATDSDLKNSLIVAELKGSIYAKD